MATSFRGVAPGERLTPDGSRRYFRIVLEPAPLFGIFDNDFQFGARQAHEQLVSTRLALPTHAPATVKGSDAYVLDVVTHPQAGAATVANLVEAVERINRTTNVRSIERVGAASAGVSTAAARDRQDTQARAEQAVASSSPLAHLSSAARSVFLTVAVVAGMWLWFTYGDR